MVSRLSVASIALAALLLVLVPYPATFSELARPPVPNAHFVDPVGSESYDHHVTRMGETVDDEEDLRTVHYGNLSPAGRELFDRTLAAERNYQGSHEYTPLVCWEGVVACPYREGDDLVPELAYDRDAAPTEAAMIVETDDGRYLFSTWVAHPEGHDFGRMWGMGLAINAGILLPVATLVGGVATRRSDAVGASAVVTAFFLTAFLGLLLGGAGLIAGGAFVVIAAVAIRRLSSDVRRGLGVAALGLGTVVALVAVGPAYLAAYTDWGTVSRTLQLGVALVLSWAGVPALVLGSLLWSHRSDVGGRMEFVGDRK